MQPQTSPQGFTYNGNPDFRGYVSANAPQYLGFVGNDGGINSAALANSISGSGGPAGGGQYLAAAKANDIHNLYNQFQGYSHQPQSGAYAGGAPAAGGGSGSGGGNVADIATYTDNISALNGLLGQADTNRQQGEQGINDSFGRSNAQLNDQQQGTTNRLNNQETDTTKGYQTNLNTIDNQARSGYQSLQALLGGSGSAGEILAPLAVSNQAGSQTNAAREGFAGNLQSISNARTDAQKQYKNAQDDLVGQKNSKLQSLISSIDQQKQNYLGQIGQQQNQLRIAQGGNYQTPTAQNANIAALQSEMNGLKSQYAQPAFTPQNVNVQAPNLNPYLAQAAQIGGGSNQHQGAAPSDPAVALQALLQKQQQQQYNPYGVK